MTTYKVSQMNLELTTACPLHCPQCYCSLTGGKHLDLAVAKKRIDEAVELGLELLNLSGGETMCYPHLYELVDYASSRVKEVNVALSGAYFNQKAFDMLIEAGITNIYISLNGSTEEINSISRDGYQLAIRALELLKKNNYPHTVINWVMHSTNADDFMNVVHLAEKYDVSTLVVMSFKPDSSNALKTFPSREQIVRVSEQMKTYRGSVKLKIETCFSNMLAYHLDTKFMGNLNIFELYKGCGAGRDGLSVNVDGNMTPCRHIWNSEGYSSMKDYWNNSPILQQMRKVEEFPGEPCASCGYRKYCRHCLAINWAMKDKIGLGFENCPMYHERTR